ncbi:MAG: HAD family hydrolase [bacterium]
MTISQQLKYVFFDLDGTLTPRPSWEQITELLGGDPEKHLEIFHDYIAGKYNTADATVEIMKLFTTNGPVTKAKLQEISKMIPFRPDAVEICQYLAKKYTLGLATSSLDLYAQSKAQELGITEIFVDVTTDWNEKNEMITFHYSKDWNNWKIKRLEKFLQEKNLSKEEIAFVGDGHNDVAIFKALPYTFAIATADNSDIIHEAKVQIKSLSELKNYL